MSASEKQEVRNRICSVIDGFCEQVAKATDVKERVKTHKLAMGLSDVDLSYLENRHERTSDTSEKIRS
jgi:hypothetical protein